MLMRFRPATRAVVLSVFVVVLVAGCGGGGGDASPPGTPPVSNRPPALTTATLSATEDVTTSVQLAATDPDNHPVTFALATLPQHGTATVTPSGALTYTPVIHYAGADTLGITVSDSAGAQVTGTIAVTVAAVDDAPVLTITQLSVNEDAALSTQLAGTDVENDPFTYQLVPGTAHGNVTLATSGALSYSPHADFAGTDLVRVRLVETASGLTSTEQIITIEVVPLNDAPAARDDTLRVTATPGQSVALTVLTNDVDVDGDTLMPSVVTQPRGGSVTVNPATRQMTFEPSNEYAGPIQFTYRLNDGHTDSGVATVRAVIGDFQGLVFLSDYTTPGITELHQFDGLDVRRVNDDLPPASNIIHYSVSGDLTTVAYVVDSNDAMRVYVKPLDGSGVAALRYTSALKSPPANRFVWAYLNSDHTYMSVTDQWSGPSKQLFVVNVATGAATQIAALMPGIVDTRFAIFHPFEPNLVMVQGQTAGNVPRDNTAAFTAFLGDASDMRTLTQIGRNYASGEYGAGEGFYFGRDPRYIYYGEQVRIGNSYPVNLLAYDRTTQAESHVVRFVFPPDRGMNGSGWWSPDLRRLCFTFYETSTTTFDGPSRFHVLDMGNPASATPVTPVLDRTSQCTFASDNRTMIYRVHSPDYVTQRAYAVDSSNPGVPRLLAPPTESASEQGYWMFAHDAMRGAITYFDPDGMAGTQGQVGRGYLLPLDGNGAPFLFADPYIQPGFTSYFYDLNAQGSFLIYARTNGVKSSLEIMSTHALNYSIPLSRSSETTGARRATWLQRYP
jgi:VCBS repeat-containing protein